MSVGFVLMMGGYDIAVYVTSFLYRVELKTFRLKYQYLILTSSCRIFAAIPLNLLLDGL